MAYVKWAHAAGERAADGAPLRRREDFFTSRLCRDWFKAFVSLMLTRVSSVTGVAYRDDPAIFAWELINEPRVQGDASGDVLQSWIEDVAAYAKTLDDAHLLTVGTEGFYGVTDAARASNEHPPGGGAERLGGDYTRNFYVTQLDFACVHLWVDLWLSCDEACKLAFAERWIVGHQNASRLAFDKPVLLEEFGKWKPLEVRDGFFKKALDLSLPPTSPVATHAGGSMFWHIDPTDYPYNEDGFSVQARFETATADIVRGAVARSSSAEAVKRTRNRRTRRTRRNRRPRRRPETERRSLRRRLRRRPCIARLRRTARGRARRVRFRGTVSNPSQTPRTRRRVAARARASPEGEPRR
jgi:mannan endo-1,4-beta-mannosidase